MTIFLMVSRFSLILVNDNFLAFSFFHYGCGNCSSVNGWASDLHLSVVNSKNLVKSNCFSSSPYFSGLFRVHMAPPIIITRQLRRLYALIASLCGTLENNSILLRSCQHFFQQYVMQVRTPPGQPAFGVVVCV